MLADGTPSGTMTAMGNASGHRGTALGHVRICDLSGQLAGAGATRVLAAFGAEVIRIEDPVTKGLWDIVRQLGPYVNGDRSPDGGSGFINHNVEKLGITLNLRTERGKELLGELVRVSNAVTENFAAGVMERLGFGYERLRELRPDVVYVSNCGFGHTGPYRPFKSWGPIAQAVSGLTHTSGLGGREPAGWGYSYMDHAGAHIMAIALLAALYHQRRTGEGQWVDLACIEAGVTLNGPAVLDATVNGRTLRDDGAVDSNRSSSPAMAPHGIYPCLGDDRWVAVACRHDEDWAHLVDVIGESWAKDQAFATLRGRLGSAGRRRHRTDRMDIGTRTRRHRRCDPRRRCARRPGQAPARAVRRRRRQRRLGPVADRRPCQARRGARRRPAGPPLGARLAHRAGRPGARAGQRAGLRRRARPDDGGDRAPRRGRGDLMGPLDGVRVIELTHEHVAWAGKLVGDLGADVVVVEPPGGSPQRSFEPFLDDQPGPERSLWWWHYNTSKRSVVADLTADRERILELVAGADVFIEGEAPGTLAALGLDWATVSARNPRLVMVSITPFGSTSARSHEPVTDLTLMAEAGPAWSCGYDDHSLPPVRGGGNQSFHTACHHAVMSLLVALLAREETGEGEHIDVSMYAASNVTTEMASYGWLACGWEVQRQTGRHAAPMLTPPVQVRCRDGRYATTGVPPALAGGVRQRAGAARPPRPAR